MQLTLAFDVYGTLIDTDGVRMQLLDMIGEGADTFAAIWRQKQLEYSFRRSLMQQYVSFDVCIAQALDYCDAYFETALSHSQKQVLLGIYVSLPPFADVMPALQQTQIKSFKRFAFSNGTSASVQQLLEHAALSNFFNGIVSIEAMQCFKPAPQVYQYFLEQTESQTAQTWLVSANPFDILGAQAQGWKTVWLNRGNSQTFDFWGETPTLTLDSLDELGEALHFYYQ